jgi:hypothetical protein
MFSKNKIVSATRQREVIKQSLSEDTYFICHKATIAGDDSVCCRGFWDSFKDHFNLGRVMQRLGGPDEVEID